MCKAWAEILVVSETVPCFSPSSDSTLLCSPSRCKELKYNKELPQISIIFIFVNEALSVILRSVHSAVNHTPTQLLKEIILVDDNSDEGTGGGAPARASWRGKCTSRTSAGEMPLFIPSEPRCLRLLFPGSGSCLRGRRLGKRWLVHPPVL